MSYTFPATVVVPVPPGITGPTSMKLTTGYAAISTDAYTITGTALVTVAKTSGDARITWNNATRKLDIAEGLPTGTYEVKLRASNNFSSATLTFTLTVKMPVYYLDLPTTFDGGTVTTQTDNINPYLAEEGDSVKLTVTPNEGYELDELYVYMLDEKLNIIKTVIIPLSGTGNTFIFTMPALNVIIVVTFSPTVGIAETDNYPSLWAYVQDGVLYVGGLTAGQTFSVYNIVGTSAYQGIANSARVEVALPGRGVYIVTGGKVTVKIINR